MENHAPGYETLRTAARTAAAEGHAQAAQSIYRRVIKLVEKQLGDESAEYAACMQEFAEVLTDCHDWEQAELAYRRALELYKQLLPAHDHRFISLLRGLAEVCRQRGEEAEARTYEAEAGAMLGERLGRDRSAD